MPSQFTHRRSRKRDTFETCEAIVRHGTSDFTSCYRYRGDEVCRCRSNTGHRKHDSSKYGLGCKSGTPIEHDVVIHQGWIITLKLGQVDLQTQGTETAGDG